jgi:two-component system chemotaxis response regulator CheY
MTTTLEHRDFSILIADDDSQCRQALADIVGPEGYQTLLASSGEEALDLVRDHDVHLVLLDMHMPRLTGLETLFLVRQYKAGLPAILVTGDATDAIIRQAVQAHVHSVIPKPVSKHVVLHTVLRALERVYRAG